MTKRKATKRKPGKKAVRKKATAPKPRKAAPEITASDLGLGSPPGSEKSKPTPEPTGRPLPDKPPRGPESIEEVLRSLGPLFPEAQRDALLRVTDMLLQKYLTKVCYVVPLQITDDQRDIVNFMIARAKDEGKSLFVWEYYEAMIRAGSL